jgi:hypothetical protein
MTGDECRVVRDDARCSRVPNASGEYFNAHVSTGLAPRTCLDKVLAETS